MTVQVWPALPPVESAVTSLTEGGVLESAGPSTPAFLWSDSTAAVHVLACSPDRRLIALGSHDGVIQLRDVGTGASLATYAVSTQRVQAMSWARFGNLLAVGGARWAIVCEALTGQEVCRFDCGDGSEVLSVSFSPLGQALATGESNGRLRVWRMAQPKNGKAMRDGSVTFACRAGNEPISSVAWSPNGQLIAVGCGKTVQLFSSQTGMHLDILFCHAYTGTISSVAWSPNGMYLAGAGMGGVVQTWEKTSRTVSTFLYDHPECQTAVNTLAWSPDGKSLLAAGEGMDAKVWSFEDGLFPERIQTAAVEPACWSMFDWPGWVPEAVRRQVEEFWDDGVGRGPQEWINGSVEQGAPPFALTVTLPGLGTPPYRETGRYVHLCNNVGRIVRADGSWACVSFSPNDTWEGHFPRRPPGGLDIHGYGVWSLLAFVEASLSLSRNDRDLKLLGISTGFRIGPARAAEVRELAAKVAHAFSTILNRPAEDPEMLRLSTELYCLRCKMGRDATEGEMSGIIWRLEDEFARRLAEPAALRQEDDGSSEWLASVGTWPEWIPQKVCERIAAPWNAWAGRGLSAWRQDRVAQGAPPLGEEVTLPDLASIGEISHMLTGRYVHCWGSIGCLVLADGTTVLVNSLPSGSEGM